MPFGVLNQYKQVKLCYICLMSIKCMDEFKRLYERKDYKTKRYLMIRMAEPRWTDESLVGIS